MATLLWPSGYTELVEVGTCIADLIRTSPGLYLEEKPNSSTVTAITYRKPSYTLENKEYVVRGAQEDTLTNQQLREELAQLQMRLSRLEGEFAQMAGTSPRGRSRQRQAPPAIALRLPLANSDVHEPRRKKVEPRKKVIEEILSSESDYLDNLYLIESVFHATFVTRCQERRISGLTKPVVAEIFGDIAHLISINSEFYERIKKEHAKGWKECRIGHVFVSYCERFRDYVPFVASHRDRIQTLRELRGHAKFAEFLSTLETSKSATLSGRNLNDLLIHPVKRIPQYIILLDRLRKHTPKSHRDYSDLCRARAEYDGLANYFEESSQNLSEAKQVLQLMGSVHIPKEFSSLEIINPQRKFCFEDQCDAVIPNSSGTTYRICAFSDCLLFLSRRRKHKRDALRRNSGSHPEWGVRYWLDTVDIRNVEFIPSTSTIRITQRISDDPIFVSLRSDNQKQWDEYIYSKIMNHTQSPVRIKSTPRIRRTLSASFDRHLDRPQSVVLDSPIRGRCTPLAPESPCPPPRLEEIPRPASFDVNPGTAVL